MDAKKSVLQIESIMLKKIQFEILNSDLFKAKINPNQIHLSISVEQKNAKTFLTEFVCEIHSNDKLISPFYSFIHYEIISKTNSAKNIKLLQDFAKIGAPFNAFVYCRELISGVTTKAFGKSCLAKYKRPKAAMAGI